jgi:signal transduction histidine kinase
VRGRDARARQIKGSGLGLSLVRDVALAHDGRVRIEQAGGGGARVVMTLPADNIALAGGSTGA